MMIESPMMSMSPASRPGSTPLLLIKARSESFPPALIVIAPPSVVMAPSMTTP